MSKKYHKRLQRNVWHELKDTLKMYRYMITEKGRIKGFYKDADGNLYSHWLSDKEIEEFGKAHKPQCTTMSFPVRDNTEESTVDRINDLRDYIDTKIQKSRDVDWGLSDNRSDRLMTETVIELQLILEKVDSILFHEFVKG